MSTESRMTNFGTTYISRRKYVTSTHLFSIRFNVSPYENIYNYYIVIFGPHRRLQFLPVYSMEPESLLRKHSDCEEAETISNDDSDKSSLEEYNCSKMKEIDQVEGLNKLKNLLEKLEASLYKSNATDNNLLLKCALLEAENKNLQSHLHDNIKLNHIFSENELKIPLSVETREKSLEIEKYGNFSEQTTIHRTMTANDAMKKHLSYEKLQLEINKLKETIADKEGELKEREETVKLLCDKYMYLKGNKIRMEIRMKKKICQLEKLLNITHEILQELQNDVDVKIENYLSKSKNMYEILFLQEKWRCNRLMYDNMRLHHEIYRLEECEKQD